MPTIPSTLTEFREDCAKFHRIIGNKRMSQDNVAGAHKALTLRYLGLHGVSDDEVEQCAMYLKIATSGALARGWHL